MVIISKVIVNIRPTSAGNFLHFSSLLVLGTNVNVYISVRLLVQRSFCIYFVKYTIIVEYDTWQTQFLSSTQALSAYNSRRPRRRKNLFHLRFKYFELHCLVFCTLIQEIHLLDRLGFCPRSSNSNKFVKKVSTVNLNLKISFPPFRVNV